VVQAAAVGDTDAISHLGHMYANGLGVEANNETALQHFWKGAEKGHAHALYGLGCADSSLPDDAFLGFLGSGCIEWST
jgi:TPR repeat protein